MPMTVHGGPSFTTWQAAKLPPNFARSWRNLEGDLLFAMAPIIVAIWDVVADALDVLAPLADELIAAGVLDP
ncbi:MAG TPA: hypothetical protein VFK70_09255 [Vicinamibacteria bacterium]|nr:hypothetical protein [Vicinamibacteria bacterium]